MTNEPTNSTGAQYVIPCKLKLDEGNLSKHAGLAQQNGFGPAFLHSLSKLVKGTAKPNTIFYTIVVMRF
jgi:hypothetical protein